MLTVSNIEKIADLFKKLLDGKFYTFVSCREYSGFKPDVRTSQQLRPDDNKDGKHYSVYYEEKTDAPKYAGFHFGDTYGVWGLSTNTDDPTYDHSYKNPYIVFEWNKASIFHRAPNGGLLYWTIAVENHRDE